MAKTSPTVTNSPATASPEAMMRDFRENQHRGHRLTHVGNFRDLELDTQPYDVWYCATDHKLLVS